MNTPLRLTDPTVFRWWFALRREARDTAVAEQARWEAFARQLAAAQRWAGEPADGPLPPCPTPDLRQTSRRLYARPWSPDGMGMHRTLLARSYLDVCYLRAGLTRDGGFAPAEGFAPLLADIWPAPVGEAADLGEAMVLTAELSPPDDVAWAWARPALVASLAELADAPPESVALLRFTWGVLGVAEAGPIWLLLGWETPEDDTTRRRDAVHDSLFPSLLTAWLKCRRLAADYEHAVHPLALRAEAAIEPDLARLHEHCRAGPVGLGEVLARLAPREAALAHAIAAIEGCRLTAEINTRNITRALADPLLAERRTELDALLAAGPRRLADQFEADLGYLRPSLDQVARAREDLSLLAQVGVARIERRAGRIESLFKVLGLGFVAFEALQTFPELPVFVRLLVLLLVATGIVWWWETRPPPTDEC